MGDLFVFLPFTSKETTSTNNLNLEIMKTTEQKQLTQIVEPLITSVLTIFYATVILYYVIGVL